VTKIYSYVGPINHKKTQWVSKWFRNTTEGNSRSQAERDSTASWCCNTIRGDIWTEIPCVTCMKKFFCSAEKSRLEYLSSFGHYWGKLV